MLPTMPATANHTMLTTLIQMFSTCMHRGVVPMFRNIKCGCILKSPKLEYSLQHVPLLELCGNMHSLARPWKSGHCKPWEDSGPAWEASPSGSPGLWPFYTCLVTMCLPLCITEDTPDLISRLAFSDSHWDVWWRTRVLPYSSRNNSLRSGEIEIHVCRVSKPNSAQQSWILTNN